MKAVTANDLETGETLYRTAAGGWSPRLAEAAVFGDEDGATALAQAEREETIVVGPYLMDLDAPAAPGGRARLRETIRAAGPTIHPQFARETGAT
ncbi:MAG: DUF2849 domain-containing protein [Pseudomonadota bacterium]